MSDERVPSIDEQGRRLAVAFDAAEKGARSRRRALRVAVPVLAVAGVAVAVLVGVGRSDSSPLSLDDAVAAVAKAVFDRPALPTDRYLHIETLTTSSGGAGAHDAKGKRVRIHTNNTFSQESWTKIGEPVLRRFVSYPGRPAGPEDAEKIKRLGYNIFPPGNRVCVSQSARPADAEAAEPMNSAVGLPLDEIPEDAAAAYRALLDDAKKTKSAYGPESVVWTTLANGMMFAGSRLTDRQRAALVGAIAYVPGVRVLAKQTDPNGRPAIGFERTGNGFHSVVYFDSDTSLTTYVKDTVVDPSKVNDGRTGLPVGATFWAYELKHYEFVDAPPKFENVKESDLPFACP